MRQRTIRKAPDKLIRVRQLPGKPWHGQLQLGRMQFRCALGSSGVSAFKREGDGHTPRATLEVLYGFYRPDSRMGWRTRLPMLPISADAGWCDESGDRNYNRKVRIPYPASHERMRREDELYDVCIVLDWNIRERRQGRGSAIFMHLARPGYLPTEGCIALSRRDMWRLLPHLEAGMRIEVTS